MSKPVYKSKTEIINFAVIILTGIQATTKIWPIPAHIQVFILAIANAVLRLITHDSVSVKRKK